MLDAPWAARRYQVLLPDGCQSRCDRGSDECPRLVPMGLERDSGGLVGGSVSSVLAQTGSCQQKHRGAWKRDGLGFVPDRPVVLHQNHLTRDAGCPGESFVSLWIFLQLQCWEGATGRGSADPGISRGGCWALPSQGWLNLRSPSSEHAGGHSGSRDRLASACQVPSSHQHK